MDRFVATGSKDRRAQDVLCFRISHDLHQASCLAFLDGSRYACHRPGADQDWPAARAGLSLGQAHAAERRVDVERVTGNPMTDLPCFAVEEVRRGDFKIIVGGVGESASAIAIA